MSVIHTVKIKPKYYEAVLSGEKNFELRKNDRNYQVGDLIRLKEYNEDFTGRDLVLKIKYILKDCPEYGLMDGFCIIGF